MFLSNIETAGMSAGRSRTPDVCGWDVGIVQIQPKRNRNRKPKHLRIQFPSGSPRAEPFL